jgi:hypothetical protein
MAETKPKKRSAPKSAGSSSKSKPKAKSQSKPKAKASSKAKPSSKPAKRKSAKPKAAKPKAAKPKAAKRAKPKSASSKSSGSKAKSPSANGSSGGSSPVEAVRNAVGGAGQTVGKVASKAKVPLVASGVAIAGAGGAMALAASKGGRKKGLKSLKGAMPKKPKVKKPKVKIKPGDLAKAAKEVGKVSAQVGEIANGIERAQGSSNGDGKHRSPVEVVLQGLTARR